MANKKQKEKQYKVAAKLYGQVDKWHPNSAIARKSQIMSAKAYYDAKEYDKAIDRFKVFASLNPCNEQTPFAIYMIGMCYYVQMPVQGRDQQFTENALKAFEDVVSRFPLSKEARDARFKLDAIKNQLATHEMDVGKFYQNLNNNISAISRFQNVIKNYETTPQAPEALYRIIECSISLGLKNEAMNNTLILGENYQSSDWYKKAYNLVNRN